jgi:serine/threonine protein kinase
MDLSEFRKLAFDCVSGMTFMQSHNMYHLNLKPENILIIDGDYVISDFGTSKII